MNETENMIAKEVSSPARDRKERVVLPSVDVYENKDEILLQVEMPGVAKKDIRIDLDNGRLTLAGERAGRSEGKPLYTEFGPVEFRRTFSVPQTIDGNKVKAELRDGILHLHLPKSEAYKPRTIEIHQG